MRACTCCSADISHRGPRAKTCEACRARGCRQSVSHRNCRGTPHHCEDCKADISHRSESAKICGACRKRRNAEATARWVDANREKSRASNRQSYRDNLESRKAGAERWRQANIEHRRDYHLRTKYGITLADFDRMYEAQGGLCACCGEARPNRTKDGLVVDHCHDSGVVRALLCFDCNKLEGYCKSKPAKYAAVIDYHSKHKHLRLVR